MIKEIPEAALTGTIPQFRRTEGRSLLDRWTDHYEWLEERSRHGIDPYSKYTTGKIAPTTQGFSRKGTAYGSGTCINFASQDYLSLSGHPLIAEAARGAVERYGVHSAGAAALMGNTDLSEQLERELADFLGFADCTVFPTGWGAGYGVVRTLVQPNDYIVLDALSHACLQEGARAATSKVQRFKNNDLDQLREFLSGLRTKEPEAGILVVTEGLFSMDSTTPNVRVVQQLCREFNATLVLDVAHDFGSLAQGGGGVLELQRMIGQVDVVMGSFSKTFASNGGFVATNHPALKLALRYNCGPLTFTNALSPIQASVVSSAIRIVRSEEGQERRERLMGNSVHLRTRLAEEGFELLGVPSAIVPVVLGAHSLARIMTRYILDQGILVNLVEFPGVPIHSSRWRLQVMADHQPQHIERVVELAVKARDFATQAV